MSVQHYSECILQKRIFHVGMWREGITGILNGNFTVFLDLLFIKIGIEAGSFTLL